MESGSELQKERFIALVSPENKLDKREDDFVGPKIIIPDIGTVSLVGSREFVYDDGDLGLTIIEDSIVVKKANDLHEMDLFETQVNLEGLGTEDTSMICRMVVPKYGIDLESDMDFDEDENEEDPKRRYYSMTVTEIWRMRRDARKLHFFAPADPKFLSQLRFSFSQIHNPPESPK